jgi:hypothetical protein
VRLVDRERCALVSARGIVGISSRMRGTVNWSGPSSESSSPIRLVSLLPMVFPARRNDSPMRLPNVRASLTARMRGDANTEARNVAAASEVGYSSSARRHATSPSASR